MGVPPAARIPSFSLADRRRKWKLQGMVSIQVLATPMRGLLRSASVNPIALNMERAGDRSRPSVMPRLRCFRSMILRDYDTRVAIVKRRGIRDRKQDCALAESPGQLRHAVRNLYALAGRAWPLATIAGGCRPAVAQL